ncbi:MAG: RNA methyltransferase [Lachnospiraceae bacterium]|nr:RNA methyltransferase [Lachnospiraceae bacterium]
MITSVGNAQVKQVCAYVQKAKERRRDRIYVVEGPRMFEEAPVDSVRNVYVAEEFLEGCTAAETVRTGENGLQKQTRQVPANRQQRILEKLKTCGYEIVSPQVMDKISDTSANQGILALLSWPQYDWQGLLAKPDGIYLVLEDLQDPGNLGTIFRTAEGAGVSGVILTKETVDIYNPKTIRATMGSIYRVPFLYADSAAEAIDRLKERGISVYAAHLKGTQSYDCFDYTKGCAFLIGNEGNGLREETAAMADTYVRIPMAGQLESLNAAVAAALLMYEAARQRRIH